MKIFVCTDEHYPVYDVRPDGQGYIGYKEVDLPVDLETVQRWQEARLEWLKANSEIDELLNAHDEAQREVPVEDMSEHELSTLFQEEKGS